MLVALSLALLQGAASQAAPPGRITVSDAVTRAIASHPSIAVARAAHDRTGADIADARSANLPRVNLDAALQQFEEPMVVLPLHGFDPRNPPLFDRSLVQSGLNASWTAYDFGLRSARSRVQNSLSAAANAALTTAQRQLAARTVNAFVRVQTARRILAAHDQRINALTAEGRRIGQLTAEGKAARLDQLRSDAEVQRARADRIATVAQLEVAEQELAQLVGSTGPAIHSADLSPLRIADTTLASDTTDATRASLVARAMRASSDVQEAEQRVNAARAGLDVARATARPELRLTGAYLERGRLKGNFAGEWQVGMAMSYPLYTGGVRSHAIDRASADERAVTAQLRLAQLGVEQGIDRALAALREAHARADALQSAVAQSDEVVRIERLSLSVGSGTQTEYLNAESNLLRTRASLAEAQNAEISARVELARLVGELTPEWLVRTVEQRQ